MDTQVNTQRLIICVFSVLHTHKSPLTVFTITYHYVERGGGGGKLMLPIKVIWLSFAHHWASIYISSYISFECHWAVPWNSTLNPTGNVHDSFLLPAMLTILEMSSLISLSYRLPLHYPLLFNQVKAEIHLFFKTFHSLFLYCFLSSMQWIRGSPHVQDNVFKM